MRNNLLTGRLEEKRILENALQSPKAEMVSVIGRRRVGKTFLVKSVYQEKIDFEITGIQHATRREQLRNFMLQISKHSGGSFPMTEPKDWLEAFYLLSKFLELKPKPEKQVVFLDELPWLATHKSGFLKGLSWFWNSWAVKSTPSVFRKTGCCGTNSTNCILRFLKTRKRISKSSGHWQLSKKD